jgi:hypothetical protein
VTREQVGAALGEKPPNELQTPRQLVAALGGGGEVGRLLGKSSAAVRQWGVRGYVPFADLLELRHVLAGRMLRYTGPVTPGLASAPR